MTTDNRTNEQLSGNTGQFTEAQVEAAAKAYQAAQNADPYDFKGRMRAALVAAQGAAPQKHPTFEEIGEDIARGIRDSLSGVAPQVPNQAETKSGNNFVSLDPEKVAALIESERDRAAAERDFAQESLGQFMAPALCEAAKRGELSA